MKIAIASGKGGTGKTTLSTNLASFLGENKLFGSSKIVLSDLDVEEPNSGLFLKGELVLKEDMYKMIPEWDKTNCNLCGKCQEVCNFNAVMKLADTIMVFPELCHGCYACSELCPADSLPMIPKKMGELKHFQLEKIDFIESKLIIGEEQAVPLIGQTIKYIDANYSDDSIKLFDSPPGTSCPVIEATKDADLVLMVTEPTPFGLHDLKLAVDTMNKLGKTYGVVINRFGIGDANVEDYCQKNNIPVVAKIPNDRKIAELYSKGELLYKKIPEVKIELQKVAEFILEKKERL